MTAAQLRAAGVKVPAYVPPDAEWPPPDLIGQLPDSMLEQLADRVASILQSRHRSLPEAAPLSGHISTTAAMRLLGYKCRRSFLRYAKRHALPYERLHDRRFRWDAAALHAHKARRTVGRPIHRG